MSYNKNSLSGDLLRRFRGCAMLSALAVGAQAPARLTAQTGSTRSPTGFTFGVGVGLGRVTLRALPTRPAVSGLDLALGWHLGYQTTPRLAVQLTGSASVYQYAGSGRRRKRSFESLMPTIEYRVADRVRLSAGGGLQLDAPAFYDVRPSNAGETHFSRGLGAMFGLSYAVGGTGRLEKEVSARFGAGFANTPDGREVGSSTAVLIGVRRSP